MFQALTLEKGKYSSTVDASGDGEVKIIGSGDNKTFASKKFSNAQTAKTVIEFTITDGGDYMLGVEGGKAKVVAAKLDKNKTILDKK